MKEIENRAEVWKSISEFYLDTELQEADYIRIARILKQSDYSIVELKDIDLYEVFPTLQSNLNSIAGEWAGFDADWLIEECKKNYNKRNDKVFRFITQLRNKINYWMRKHHWRKVEEHMMSTQTQEEIK
jgi:hypothetical protein